MLTGQLSEPEGSAWMTVQWLSTVAALALQCGGQELYLVLGGAFAKHHFSLTRAVLYPISRSLASITFANISKLAVYLQNDLPPDSCFNDITVIQKDGFYRS